jgi:voltage-gated potassium channel
MVMKALNIIVEILIILSLMAFAVETVPTLDIKTKHFLDIFEMFTVIIFTVEYIIRVSVGKLKYIKSFFGIIDLVSIIPGIFFLAPELSMLKIFRLARLFRMFKFLRYVKAFRKIGRAIVKVKKELISYMILNFLMIYILSVLMYYFEKDAQPDKFKSILDSMWWAVVTLTTIGYGDVYPVTIAGKVVTGVISILGVGIITIPTGLIASTLIKSKDEVEEYVDPHLESLPDRGFINNISEGDNEINEKGKLRGFE